MTVYFRDRTEQEDEQNPTAPPEPQGLGASLLDLGAAANPGVAVGRWLTSPDQVTNYRYGRYRDNLRGERLAIEHIYDEADDEVHRITGQRIGNPERDDFLDPLSQRNFFAETQASTEKYDLWHERLAQMAASDPRLAAVLQQYGSREQVNERAFAYRQSVTDEYHTYLGDGGTGEQIVRGLLGAPGMIVGGLSSGSPDAVSQLAAGGPSGRSLNILERATLGAAANIVGQGAVEPSIIDDARRMGEQYPDRQVWLDFLIAGGFGAVMEGGPAVIDRALNPPPIEADTTAPLQELANVFERWNGQPPQEALDRFAQTPAGEVLQQQLAGQAESLIVSAHSRDAMVARAFPDLADQDIVATADEIVANQRFVNGEDEFPSRTGQARRADPEEVAAARRTSDDAPMPEPGTRETIRMGGRDRPRTFDRFNAAELRFDPSTFQYKQSEGATGSTGVLAGVEQWDNQSSGKIVVFEAADGTRYVADGHQRTALAQAIAQRDGSQIMLDGVLYRESEGWTAREVRNLAAQKNLRETPGDPIDTAQLIREAPELIDSSVPQRSAGFRVARGLAALSDEAFRAVRAGQIEPRLGAVIGEVAAGRPETHEPLARLFAENPPRTIREATFIAHEAMQAEVFRAQTAQMSMFGDAPELAGMRERASILNAASTQLRQDRRLFEIASRNAEELEAAGNVLSREENARRADLSEALLRHLDMLATRPSEVSRLLREVAATAAEQKLSPSVAANRFVNGVIDLFNSRGLIGLMQEQAPPVRAPEPINAPMLPRVQKEERASVLRGAHDLDDEARAQSLAEVAVERALRGEVGDDIPLDAIGYTPEADLARIERALDALGVDDPTVAPVAAALYARPTPDMELEARMRLTGEQTPDAPRTFAEVAEQSATPEIFNPLDIEDEAAMLSKIDGATLPQLDKIQRTFGLYGAGDGASTRAEFRAAFLQEWRDVYGPRGFFSKGDGPDAGPVRGGINPVVPPPPEGARRLFNASTVDHDPNGYLDPHVSGWVEEVANGAGDFDNIGDITRPLVYMSDNPESWVRMIVGRKIGKHPNDVTIEDIRAHGRLNIVDADPEYDNIFQVGEHSADDSVTTLGGERRRMWETNLYDSEDFREMPVGPEPDDFISREPVQVAHSLTGDDLVRFLEQNSSRTAPDGGGAQIENLRSQGFDVDTPLFHGTTREFTEFQRGSTPNRAGELDEGIWLAKDQGMARGYGEGAGGRTLTVYTRGRYFRPEDNPALQAELNAAMHEYPAGPERILRERGYAGYDLEGSRLVFDPADIVISPSRNAPNAGSFALREPSLQPLSTVADWTRAVQREFPRYGKKLLERARLMIVQTVDELPDGGRGFYARLFDGVSKPEQRARIAESLEHVRTSMDGAFDVTDVYAWRSSKGSVMAAEIMETDPRMGAHVSFGALEPGGIRIDMDDATGSFANAVESFTAAMAAIDRDVATNRRVAYRFSGYTGKHMNVYARMMAAIEPPAGYMKTTVLGYDGRPTSFLVLREDIASANKIGTTMTLDQALAMQPGTMPPRSDAMANKRDFLYGRQPEDLQALIDKASVPPRPGAFARGRGVIGYSEGGQSWIVAGNAPVELARGLTIHEIGKHVGVPEMLGQEAHEMLLDQVQRLHEDGDPDIVAGRNAVPRDTPESQIWDEALAYALQNADEGSMSTGFRGVVMRLLNSLRAWLWKNVPAFRDMTHLTFEDMQFLALGGLRHAASTDPRMIDVRSLPTRIREAMLPKPRLLQDAVADAGSGWLNTRVFHGKSDRPGGGMTFMSPSAKIAGIYGEIEAYEVRGPIHDASDELIRTQDDFNRVVAEARKAGATGVYTSALDRGKLGAQEQIVMFDSSAVRPAGSGRVDMSNPASVAAAEADNMDRVMTMLEHCQ